MEIMRFEINNIAKHVKQRLCRSLFLKMLQSSSSQEFTFFEILQIRILQIIKQVSLLEHFYNASASIFMSFIRLQGFRKVSTLKDLKWQDFPFHLEQMYIKYKAIQKQCNT